MVKSSDFLEVFLEAYLTDDGILPQKNKRQAHIMLKQEICHNFRMCVWVSWVVILNLIVIACCRQPHRSCDRARLAHRPGLFQVQLRDGRLSAQAARLGAVQQLPCSDEDNLEGLDAEAVPFHLRSAGCRSSLSGHARYKAWWPAFWWAWPVFSTTQSIPEGHSTICRRTHIWSCDTAFSGEHAVCGQSN